MASPLDIKPEEVDPTFSGYLQAFIRLNRDRPVIAMSSGVAYLPLSAFVHYFQLFEPLDSVELDTNRLMILDSEYVSFKNEMAEAQPKQFKSKFKSRK